MLKITLQGAFNEIEKIYNKLMLKMIKLTIMKIQKNDKNEENVKILKNLQ